MLLHLNLTTGNEGFDTALEIYQGPEDVFLNYVWYVDLLEVVDLNGDGLAELLFDGYAWESSGTNVVDLTIDLAEAVLRTGCGV